MQPPRGPAQAGEPTAGRREREGKSRTRRVGIAPPKTLSRPSSTQAMQARNSFRAELQGPAKTA
jgi:hypothetical protein